MTEPTNPSFEREGASGLDSPPLDKVVWLRGDEPWFSEFDLNAEQVMEMLGIKRSRLTQISGKELRVGRARMGRYLRPIFRKQDVDEYLHWARAPISRKKTSDALMEASRELREQSAKFDTTDVNKELQKTLEEFLNEKWQAQQRQTSNSQNQKITQHLKNLQISLTQSLFDGLDRIGREFGKEGLLEEFDQRLETLEFSLREMQRHSTSQWKRELDELKELWQQEWQRKAAEEKQQQLSSNVKPQKIRPRRFKKIDRQVACEKFTPFRSRKTHRQKLKKK